jgi:flagellar basal-body rod modification protein FlgD
MSYTISNTATTNTNPTTSTSGTSGSTSNASSAKTLDSDFSTFLTLLTTQVQHQDPTSPMDTTQWTNQLVQYSSVEQQIKSNTYLSTIASNSGNNMSSAVNYIGKTITASSATSALSNGSANWSYDVGSNAAKVALKVTDSNGTVVYSGTGNTASGEHAFSWDGTTTSGTKDTGGNYTLSVTATDASGNSVTSSVGVGGTVNSVQTDSSGNLTLTLNNGTEVPISTVTGVATAS